MNKVNNISIRHWAEEDKPREKLLLKGQAALTNAELLAIIIGSGTRKLSAVALSKIILNHYNNDLNNLGRLNLEDLQKFKGIGEAKAVSIIAALEIGRRRNGLAIKDRPKIMSSKDAYQCVVSGLQDLNHEEFKILLLNRNNRVIRLSTISKGGVAGTVVDPKIIFKLALDIQASAIILCHNHPSGNLQPSQADIDITRKIVQSGKLLEIKVLDHLIVANSAYYSFADEGMI
jgi:DNA repair protein RadC